jgi:hypothetical protein
VQLPKYWSAGLKTLHVDCDFLKFFQVKNVKGIQIIQTKKSPHKFGGRRLPHCATPQNATREQLALFRESVLI